MAKQQEPVKFGGLEIAGLAVVAILFWPLALAIVIFVVLVAVVNGGGKK